MGWSKKNGIWQIHREPTCITAFDAAQFVTLNGGNVSAWGNLASNRSNPTFNAVQANTSLQPQYNASDANFAGRPSIYLASLKYLRTGTWPSEVAQPLTYYAVARMTTASGYQFTVDGLDATHRCCLYNNLNSTRMFAGTEQGSAATSTATCVYCCEFNGADSKLFRNDTTTNLISGSVGLEPLQGLTFGVNGVTLSDSPANGWLAEFAAFTGTHSPAIRRRIMSRLGSKYGIVIS